jgi:hypothetical protein
MHVIFILALPIFGVLAIVKPHDNRWVHCLIVMLTAVVVSGSLLLFILTKLGPRLYAPVVYDQWFFVADTWLGSPSWRLGQVLATYPLLGWMAKFSYASSFYMTVFAVIVTMVSQGVARGWKCFATVTSQTILAWPFYEMFPACGPVYAFSGFPWHIPKLVAPHVMRLNAYPNCMPSVHMTSALMFGFFLGRWRVGRWLGSVNVALTVLATLGLGEHYLIDLLAALPFTYVLLRVWGWIPRQDANFIEDGRKALEREQVKA